MIRPGSLDVLPDCLDGRRLEPEARPARPDALSLVLWGLLAVVVLAQVAVILWDTAAAACPLWILQGQEGRLIFAC